MNLDELYKLINDPLRGHRIDNDLVTIKFQAGVGNLEKDGLRVVSAETVIMKLSKEEMEARPGMYPAKEKATITFKLDIE